MPQYTVEAFRWTGTGYNAQYNTSYTAVLNDDDATYQGGGDGNETISINGGAFNATNSTPYTINVSFTDTDGNAHVEPFHFFNTAGPPSGWYFVPEPDSAFTVGATLGSYQSHTSSGWDYATVTCFANGTLIETDEGPRRVEDLGDGAQLRLADGRLTPLLAVICTHVPDCLLAGDDKMKPVKISAGALGLGLPKRDLWVSRQHRMLVRSAIAERMFGAPEVLLPAHRLCALPGIFLDHERESVSYYHLVVEGHDLVLAEGTPSESFYPGNEALAALPAEARAEFEALFPNLELPRLARPEPKLSQQKRLVERHAKNARPLLSAIC